MRRVYRTHGHATIRDTITASLMPAAGRSLLQVRDLLPSMAGPRLLPVVRDVADFRNRHDVLGVSQREPGGALFQSGELTGADSPLARRAFAGMHRDAPEQAWLAMLDGRPVYRLRSRALKLLSGLMTGNSARDSQGNGLRIARRGPDRHPAGRRSKDL